MPVTAIVGANWGDEGKGKITDFMASRSDYVVRFQGGNNAGHTIINGYGKFALHLLPSGVFYPHVQNILGPGVAVNIEAFLKEYNDLLARNVPAPKVKISDRAQIILPYHILFDELEEERLGKEGFGSTKTGIAPFYSDKYQKIGIQINEIFDENRLKKRLKKSIAVKNIILEHLYHRKKISVDGLIGYLRQFQSRLAEFIADTSSTLHVALKAGKRILLEGQLGALRDPDHGIYPFPTSSSPLAGFGSVGAGIPPQAIKKIIAVTKAYSTCVGAGPFVTELFGNEGSELRERGGDSGEYGATTGRPRRVGWFDCVATRYGLAVQGANEAALTNLDVLGYLDKIKVCTRYKIGKTKTGGFPVTRLLENAKPEFTEVNGWKKNISDIKDFRKLPRAAREYVKFLENQIEVPIKWISVGPRREQMIVRR